MPVRCSECTDNFTAMFCPVMEKLPGSFLVGVAVVPAIRFSFAGFFLCGEMLKGRHSIVQRRPVKSKSTFSNAVISFKRLFCTAVS